MEVRKSRQLTEKNVIARPSKLGRGNLKKKLVVFGTWLLVFGLLVQSALALTANVRIEAPNQTIFQGDVNVPESVTVNNQIISGYKEINALVAASKVGNFTFEVTDWGAPLGFALDSVNGISNPAYAWWAQRINLAMAQLGISNQPLNDGDQVLLHLTGTPDNAWSTDMPLKLEVSSTNLKENESLSFKTTFFDDNTSTFKPISASVKIGNQSIETNQNGEATTSFAKDGTYTLFAEKQGYVRSNRTKITVKDPNSNIQPPAPNPKKLAANETKEAVNRAQMFLKKRLAKNGRIENPAVTAWAAMAFASINIDPNKVMRKKGIPRKKWRSLMDYLLHYTRTSLNKAWLRKHRNAAKPLATDYARQIMAVTAAKKNPRNFGKINLVKELSRYYRGKQFGSATLVNDDIFTIIAYRSANVNPKLKPFKDAIRFVKKNQHADGGFSYSTNPAMNSETDTTAAAIQALVIAKKAGIKNLDAIIEKAYNYLVSKQSSDGGFAYNSQFNQSNIGSTSWASQAIAAYKGGSAVDNLTASSGATPLYFASTLQNLDGGFGYSQGSASDAWNTTQAIPALLKKPWPIKKR